MAESGESGSPEEADGVVGTDRDAWTPEARDFDRRLRQAIALLDPFMDAPPEKLAAVYRGASARGRRALITLVGKQVSLLGTLRVTLEKIEVEGGKYGAAGGVARTG